MRSIEDYRYIVGDKVIGDIYKRARRLYGKHVLHINSTFHGGGVAEILRSFVPLMNDVGLVAGWRILHGSPDFFGITKKFHNSLQGAGIRLTRIKEELYREANEDFSIYTHIHHDCVVIHDLQPLPLIKFYQKRQPWLWRCHIDLSEPNEELWDYLKGLVLRYDMVIVSSEDYKKVDLPVEQRVIHPAIDPLSSKNKELTDGTISKYLKKFGIPVDKPLIVQVSRFDRWKDPLGVVDIFKHVKEEVDCRLVLCGSMATDDPEAYAIYKKVESYAKGLIAAGDVILLAVENNLLVNVLQRAATIIIQKSLREGFGLTVTEGLWKMKPVVASRVGGIPLQIVDGVNGFLLDPKDNNGFADKIIELLKEPDMARQIGKMGQETVREKFLITRLLLDHLKLLEEVMF